MITENFPQLWLETYNYGPVATTVNGSQDDPCNPGLFNLCKADKPNQFNGAMSERQKVLHVKPLHQNLALISTSGIQV